LRGRRGGFSLHDFEVTNKGKVCSSRRSFDPFSLLPLTRLGFFRGLDCQDRDFNFFFFPKVSESIKGVIHNILKKQWRFYSASPNSRTGSGPVLKSPCSETGSDPVSALTELESPSSSDGDELSSTSTISMPTSFGPRIALGSNCNRKGFQTTKFHPNSNGISSNPNPTEFKFKLFKNLKELQIMGKEGEITSPIPSRNAIKSLIETEEKTGDGGEAM